MAVGDIFAASMGVVVRGAFNPAILSPAWFHSEGLIGQDELDAAEIGVVTREYSAFQAGWLRVESSLEHLSASTLDLDETERVRDAVVGTLHRLKHTPVAAMGINCEFHFDVGGETNWHKVGNRLAPKEYWSSLSDPGMRSLSLIAFRPDEYRGRILLRVEPSGIQLFAVFVSHNDHYDLEVREPGEEPAISPESTPLEASREKLETAIEVLNRDWSTSWNRSQRAMDDVTKVALG